MHHSESILDTLLQINDQINTVLGRYDAFRRGDYAAAANPLPDQYTQPAAPTSLIDFDDPTPAPTAASNDLDVLFGGLGAASPPPVNPATRPPTHAPPRPQTHAQIGGSIMLPSTPTPGSGVAQIPRQAGPPGYFDATGAARPQQPPYFNGTNSSSIAQPQMQPQQPRQQPQATSPPQGKDPFADLAGLF